MVAPINPEFRVNANIDNTQESPAIATDNEGNFVIAWQSLEQDGHGYGIYAQRYDADSNPLGEAFQVNTYTDDSQSNPAVAMDANGNFMVTWMSVGQEDSSDIYLQRYDANGNPVGEELQVNAYTENWQGDPIVAMNANGNAVITWSSYAQDGHSVGVYAQYYGADGNPLGEEFQVNTFTEGWQGDSAVAMDDNGNFIITWMSFGQDGSRYGVYAQRYDADGNPLGEEFQVNTYTEGSQQNPAIAVDHEGNVVIAWQSFAQDGDGYGVYAQRYDADGNPLGAEFRVNTDALGYQENPAVAIDGDGNFIIAWRNSVTEDNNFDTTVGIQAQLYNADGTAVGEQLQINTNEVNLSSTVELDSPVVAMDDEGDFVVSWSSGELWNGDLYARQLNSGSEVAGTDGNDALVGTDGNDIITGFQGADVLTGGEGNDRFVYTAAQDGFDTITDFTVGGDRIVLDEVFDALGYAGNDPIADGYLQLLQLGTYTLVQFDTDGFGAAEQPQPLIMVQDVTVAELNDLNNFLI